MTSKRKLQVEAENTAPQINVVSGGNTEGNNTGRGKYQRIGQIRQGDDGSYYLKIEQDVTLTAGQSLTIEKPESEIDRLVERGFITEDEGDARKAKVPTYVKYNVKVRPAKQGNATNF